MKIRKLTPEPVALVELGERLERIRKQRGATQEELAEKAGIGVATLRRIESGKDAKLGSWLRILMALDMAGAIDALLPEKYRSPMADAKARRPLGGSSGFRWGDERE